MIWANFSQRVGGLGTGTCTAQSSRALVGCGQRAHDNQLPALRAGGASWARGGRGWRPRRWACSPVGTAGWPAAACCHGSAPADKIRGQLCRIGRRAWIRMMMRRQGAAYGSWRRASSTGLTSNAARFPRSSETGITLLTSRPAVMMAVDTSRTQPKPLPSHPWLRCRSPPAQGGARSQSLEVGLFGSYWLVGLPNGYGPG